MIFLILVLALVLRVINLNQSLWLDEAISALAARDFSYYGIIFDFLKIDNHPPIFYLLLKLWGSLFGFIDVNLRILPVIISIAVVYFSYKISGLITENKQTKLAISLAVATSPILVYFSQEIRMYILITLLCTIQIYVFIQILKKPSKFLWSLFAAFSCLLFFSDYITVFFFPIFIIFPIFKKNKSLLIKTLMSFIPLSVLFVFWFPIFNEQLIKNQQLTSSFPGWSSIIGGATFKNLVVAWMKFILGRISFDPKILYYALIGFFSIPTLIGLVFACKNYKKNLLIWLWFFIPIALGFAFSFFVPVFNYFRFIYVIPAFIILTVIGLKTLKPILFIAFISWIILGNVVGLLIYYFDSAQQRENWKQAVSFIEENGKSDDLVVFEYREEPAPYRWYSKGKIDSLGATDSYFADQQKTSEKLEKALEGKNSIYYFEYLRDLSDPNRFVEQKLKDENFSQKEVYNDFHNIGQIIYWSR